MVVDSDKCARIRNILAFTPHPPFLKPTIPVAVVQDDNLNLAILNSFI